MKTQRLLAAFALAAVLAASADTTYNVPAGTTQTLSGVTVSEATIKDGEGTLSISGDNSFKRDQVEKGTLKFSGGNTSIYDTSATGDTYTGAILGQIDGNTIVTGGATVTAGGGKYVIISKGMLKIENGTFDASGKGVFNAFRGATLDGNGCRIVIGDGGILKADSLRPSGEETESSPALKDVVGIDLNAGGELHIGQFWADENANRYGRINFNGGVLYPQRAPTLTQTGYYLFNNDTVAARRPWTQDQITPTILEGGAYIDLSVGNNYVQKSFASGAEHDGGLHIRGTKILYWNAKDSTFNGGTWLEGNGGIFVVDASKGDDSVFGACPASPQDNIFITGANHTLFNQSGTFEVGANRNVFVKDGVRFRVAGNADSPLVLHGEIHGEVADGAAYPTGTALHVRGDWNGPVVLDPGAGRTNDVGRLVNYGRLEITSGVTRVTSSVNSGTTDANALVFASGNGTSFSDARTLAVNGGSLVAPNFNNATRFVVAEKYASVAVANGGVIDMPYTEYVNGLNSPARLSIENGTVRVKNFQLANGTQSEVNFGKDGMLEITGNTGNNLRKYGNGTATLNFDGGGIRASGAQDIQFENTATSVAGCSFNVLEGGAVFDADKKNIWLSYPLLGGVAGGATDGGVRKVGAQILVFNNAENTYNGPTTIAQGAAQVRVDNALPAGGTLSLENDGNIHFCKYDKSSSWTSTRTAQTLGRIEGNGRVSECSAVTLDGVVAPAAGGTITLNQNLGSMSGTFEVRCEEGGSAGKMVIEASGGARDISGMKVAMVNPEKFDKSQDHVFYEIAVANGIRGSFDVSGLPDGWHVRVLDGTSDGATGMRAVLRHTQPFVMVVR